MDIIKIHIERDEFGAVDGVNWDEVIDAYVWNGRSAARRMYCEWCIRDRKHFVAYLRDMLYYDDAIYKSLYRDIIRYFTR